MSRSFSGAAANYIQCSVGNCAPAGTGAYTMISLVRKDFFQRAGCTFTLRRTGTNARDLIETGNLLFGVGDFSSGFGPVPAGDASTWIWLVERKAAGAAHYRMAYALYPVIDPNVDIIFGEAPDAANHGDPGSGDEVWLGEGDLHARGLQALHVLYAADLTDAQIKTALTTALTDLMALSPVGCWPLNQALASDPVVDVTGGGADETATVGTVGVDAANPPGYNFSLAATITGTITGTFPALQAAFTGTVVSPVPPSGDGDLTVTVAAYGQLEAVAQRILCWAGDPEQLLVTARQTGLARLFLPEHAFGVGPLRLKTAGPDVLAGFLPGDHRLIPVGNVDATETDPNTCAIVATPRPNSLTTRVGGNPAAVLLDYTSFSGGVDILWGDGAASLAQPAAATVAHTYPGEGQFTVTIRDTDDFANAAIFDIAVP